MKFSQKIGYTFLALVLGFLVVANLAGCASVHAGYFYVQTASDGYIITSSTPDGSERYISKPMSITDATRLCNQLNKDLGSNAYREK